MPNLVCITRISSFHCLFLRQSKKCSAIIDLNLNFDCSNTVVFNYALIPALDLGQKITGWQKNTHISSLSLKIRHMCIAPICVSTLNVHTKFKKAEPKSFGNVWHRQNPFGQKGGLQAALFKPCDFQKQ